jgi:2,3-bisphosphoglycerate-independent phosphoglycerate mutase
MKKVVLAILDGFGCRKEKTGNAVAAAKKDNFDKLWQQYPHTMLSASGEDVGLPQGQMGNSEVGHLNIGAGRIVYQELVRINKSIENGEIEQNEEILKLFEYVKNNNKKLHFIGLVSDGGVHSHQHQLNGLLEFAKKYGVQEVVVHAFLDGRDVPPRSAEVFLKILEEKLKELNYPPVASIMGRYYSMDRDKRWERIQMAYDSLTRGEAYQYKNSLEALEAAYQRGEDDEFVKPSVISTEEHPYSPIGKEEGVFCFNFRSDRVRQLTRALTDADFNECKIERLNLKYLCLTEYDVTLNVPVAFKPINMKNTLGEFLGLKNKKQLRIAETEKYAHVTFFFNGGVEKPNPGEERVLIPSPKVATYDLQPEMSAPEVCKALVEEINKEKYDFILVNFANADMVGHTGYMNAAVKAIETVDKCLGEVYKAAMDKDMVLLVTADHGNAELMLDLENNKPLTAHTTFPVPFIVAGYGECELRENGILGDISPTILKIMGIEQPEEMTGESIIKK